VTESFRTQYHESSLCKARDTCCRRTQRFIAESLTVLSLWYLGVGMLTLLYSVGVRSVAGFGDVSGESSSSDNAGHLFDDYLPFAC
jgi:hypothetical protein